MPSKRLSQFWHPIATVDEIGDAPQRFTLLDEDLVAFRSAEGISVFKDLCIHRGAALSLWSRDFVRAATAMGQGPLGITLRHVLPNILSVLIVQATIQFAVAILAEAGLSFLGLGAQPPVPSWGRMLRDAQTYIFQAPELAVWPGLAIALAVLGLNMLGDGLRDLLDPRLRLMRVG